MSAASHVASVVGVVDARTRIGVPLEPRVDRARMEEVYDLARRSLAADPRPPRAGYALFWARGEELHQLRLPEEETAFAVIGRHSRCDVHLRLDSEVSLRHLLMRVRRTVEGTLSLQLLDLRAELPFYLTDDEPHSSLSATGPLVVRLGRYVLVALPTENVGLLPATMPDPEIVDERRRTVPPPARSASVVSVREGSEPLAHVGGSEAGSAGRILLTKGERSATAWVTQRQLDRGLLIGRYRRCFDAGLREVLGLSVSRTHLLVIADGHNVLAYDLCSRNGTWSGPSPIRVQRIGPGYPTIALSRPTGVSVEWFPRH